MRALAIIVVAGCFDPALPSGFPCGTDGFCPSPLVCQSDGICRNPDEEAPPDAPPLPPPNFAFVSSAPLVPGNLGLGGLDSLLAADMHCQTSAMMVGRPGRYVAWLSTMGADPRNNVANAFGTARGWVRRDGSPVVDTLEDLLAGRLLYPLRTDENGVRPVSTAVMTATSALGLASGNDCAAFTMTAGVLDVGAIDGGTAKWTIATQMADVCDDPLPVFCFQIDHESPITPPTPSGLIAFLSDGLFTPTSGRDGADLLCQTEADAAMIPGTFRSFLGVISEIGGPIARFLPLPNQPWVRLDGVPTTRDFVTWEASISVTSQRNYIQDTVFVGGRDPNVSPGLGNQTCGDWTGGGGSLTGDSARASSDALGTGMGNCQPHRIYCLQTQ